MSGLKPMQVSSSYLVFPSIFFTALSGLSARVPKWFGFFSRSCLNSDRSFSIVTRLVTFFF